MNSLIIMLLLACSAEDHRMSWSQHMPEWDFPTPTGDVMWTIAEGSTPDREKRFARAIEDWQVSLSCRFTPRKVDRIEDANLIFFCEEPPFSLADHGKITTAVIDDNEGGAVWVKPELCDTAGQSFFHHAVGHSLGFADKQKWYETTMDQASIRPEAWDAEFPALERDGLRIWALSEGAPGCGDRESQWSWELDPTYYKGDPPDVSSLISRKS